MTETLTISRQIDHVELAGPARTTAAGRFSLPIALKDGLYTVTTYQLVLDETAATELYDALGRHLAGQGAQDPAQPTRRSRADLLQ